MDLCEGGECKQLYICGHQTFREFREAQVGVFAGTQCHGIVMLGI